MATLSDGDAVKTHLFTNTELGNTLKYVGDLLGVDVCYYLRGGFHFKVNAQRTVAIFPESAGRFRVTSCENTVPTDTKWSASKDRARLASLVLDAAEEQTSVGIC